MMSTNKTCLFSILIVLLLINDASCSNMRQHHARRQRRGGDAEKEMIKEECDVLANDYIQKFQDKTYEEIREPMVAFFKKCIVEMFDFEMEASPDDKDKQNYVLFKEFPTFEEKKFEAFSPLKKEFGLYAKVIEIFFTKVGEWKRLLKDNNMKDSKGKLVLVCKNLLYTVGARYAYTTFLLWHVSDGTTVRLCKADGSDRIFRPDSSCYPVPAGNHACTSESEIGLIGKDAPIIVQKFNKYITGLQCQTKSNSQHSCAPIEMLDHTVSADAIEIATPELFVPSQPTDEAKRLEGKRAKVLASMDKSYEMKWFDLVLALVQVARRQDGGVHAAFRDQLLSLVDGNEDLTKAFGEFLQSVFDKDVQKKSQSYDEIVKLISKELSKAMSSVDVETKVKAVFSSIQEHLKATDSYHSFGALRSIVATTQMRRKEMTDRMSLNDYLAAAIENFGFAQGTMAKCVIRQEPTYKCVAESSKYLWLTYSCLKATKDILVNIGQGESLSEEAKMDTVKARDYLAELYFVFAKNKREMPEEYFSSLAYKEDVIVEEDGKQEVEPKEQKSKDLMKRFFQCELAPECMRKLSKTILEYTKSMSQYQNKTKAKRKRIIDISINRLYFDYVTESSKKIVECYKEFMFGSKDPCKIKATIKLRSSAMNLTKRK